MDNIAIMTSQIGDLILSHLLLGALEVAVIALPLLGFYNALLADAPLTDDEKKVIVPSFMMVGAIAVPFLILIGPVITGHVMAGLNASAKMGLVWLGVLGIGMIGFAWLRIIRKTDNVAKLAFQVVAKFIYHNGIHTTFVKYYPIMISLLHILVTLALVGVMGNSMAAGKMNIVGTSLAWLLHPILFLKQVNIAREKLGLKPYRKISELLGLNRKEHL